MPFQNIVSDQDKVLLVGLKTDDISQQRFEDGLQELTRLVETAGGTVADTVQQFNFYSSAYSTTPISPHPNLKGTDDKAKADFSISVYRAHISPPCLFMGNCNTALHVSMPSPSSSPE